MGLSLLLAAILSIPAAAQGSGAVLTNFCGLNNADSPATLEPCESPDLLNVESNLQGTAIKKRGGFQEFADLTVASSPVTGSHSFVDASGNRLDIVCQDRNCAKSTNGNAFSVFISTAAAEIKRWSFVDAGGILYGGNSKYDSIMAYNGTTRRSPATMPVGSILELAHDRLVIADIKDLPNRVHYSSSGAYEMFTTGVNPEDSFWDEIGAPGDKIRGLKFLDGVLYIFKTASITGCELGDQYSTRCAVISPNIGTTDPGSIVAAGSCIYFRSQDKNYWEICRGGLREISLKIPALVKSQSGGLAGGEFQNTQTTLADWQAGVQNPTGTFNTATIPGSIFPSSVTFQDTTGTQFGAGTVPSALTTSYISGAVVFSSAPHRIYNGDFEQGTCADGVYWTCTTAGASAVCAFNATGAIGGSCGAQVYTTLPTGANASVRILHESVDTILFERFYNQDPTTTSGGTIDLYALGFSTRTLRVQFNAFNGANDATATSSTFTAISSITWGAETGAGTVGFYKLDNIQVNRYFSHYQSSATPATFFSKYFDVVIATPVGGPFSISGASETGTSFSGFQIRSSSTGVAGNAWDAWVNTSTSSRISTVRRFQQYNSTFTTSVGTVSPVLYDVSLPFTTTGTFKTACIQPNATISAWGTMSAAETTVGGGSIVYYATSAATCATLPVTTPPEWATSVTNNATLSIDTNTAVYIGWRSLIGSTTDQAQVDAVVLAWNEGTPVQPVWAVYDSVKNAVFWTSTVNGSSSTNRLLKYDRNLDYWYPWDIPAQAPRIINNSLYFGGASSGTWNLYGLVDADLGQSINAYWKSKDFGGDQPFLEKNFRTASILSGNSGTGSMTATWTLSNSKTGNYTVSLATGTGIKYALSNFALPFSSPQRFINLKVGNNSAVPFEVLGIGLTWDIIPWKVGGP